MNLMAWEMLTSALLGLLFGRFVGMATYMIFHGRTLVAQRAYDEFLWRARQGSIAGHGSVDPSKYLPEYADPEIAKQVWAEWNENWLTCVVEPIDFDDLTRKL